MMVFFSSVRVAKLFPRFWRTSPHGQHRDLKAICDDCGLTEGARSMGGTLEKRKLRAPASL